MNDRAGRERPTLRLPQSAQRAPKPWKPAKPRRWSHQDDLNELIGKDIVLLADSGPLAGTLVAADQFTIKLLVRAESAVTALASVGVEPTLTIFKHAIRGYSLALNSVQ